MTTETANPRSELRAWLRDAIKDAEEVHLPSLTESAMSWFGTQDGLREALSEQLLRQAVYQEAQGVVGLARSRTMHNGEALTEEEFEKKRSRFATRFLSWYEHVGDKHVRLMDADRTYLLAAAKLRRDRGVHELHLAVLFEEMADGLEGGQKVADRFSAEEIEAMFQRAKADGS